jgi:hypothetical protein
MYYLSIKARMQLRSLYFSIPVAQKRDIGGLAAPICRYCPTIGSWNGAWQLENRRARMHNLFISTI